MNLFNILYLHTKIFLIISCIKLLNKLKINFKDITVAIKINIYPLIFFFTFDKNIIDLNWFLFVSFFFFFKKISFISFSFKHIYFILKILFTFDKNFCYMTRKEAEFKEVLKWFRDSVAIALSQQDSLDRRSARTLHTFFLERETPLT